MVDSCWAGRPRYPLLRRILHNTCHTVHDCLVRVQEWHRGDSYLSSHHGHRIRHLHVRLPYLRVASEGRRSSCQTQRTGTRTYKYMHICSESISAHWPSLGSLDQATASARLTELIRSSDIGVPQCLQVQVAFSAKYIHVAWAAHLRGGNSSVRH